MFFKWFRNFEGEGVEARHRIFWTSLDRVEEFRNSIFFGHHLRLTPRILFRDFYINFNPVCNPRCGKIVEESSTKSKIWVEIMKNYFGKLISRFLLTFSCDLLSFQQLDLLEKFGQKVACCLNFHQIIFVLLFANHWIIQQKLSTLITIKFWSDFQNSLFFLCNFLLVLMFLLRASQFN